jgi:hypothetical protein
VNKHQQRIDDTNRRQASIARIEGDLDEVIDPKLLEAFKTMDPELLGRIQVLVSKARSAGWNEGCHDTERQYDERL